MRSKISRYPFSVAALHWLVATVMISTLAIGWLLDDHDELVTLHKSLGLTVLMLAILRILNRLANRNHVPDSVNTPGTIQYIGERAVHGLLYLSMLIVPVLGWLKTNAAGHPASFFGLFNLPDLLTKNTELSHSLGEIHSAAATVFAVTLGLHVLGALFHLVVHGENVFTRVKLGLKNVAKY